MEVKEFITRTGKSNILFVTQDIEALGRAPSDADAAYALVEKCGRAAWVSDRREGDTAEKFLTRIAEYGHLSVFEHSNITINIPAPYLPVVRTAFGDDGYFYKRYSRGRRESTISGSFRSWMESNVSSIPEIQKVLHERYPLLFNEPTAIRMPAFTPYLVEDNEQGGNESIFVFDIITDRGITHEIVRHRTLQFTQESTRYVNYSNKGYRFIASDEFENDSTIPYGFRSNTITLVQTAVNMYEQSLKAGYTPQIARDLLPNILASRIIVSGRWSAFSHFIELRNSKKAHPRIQRLAAYMRGYFAKLGYFCDKDLD